jgi:hypothetical protein
VAVSLQELRYRARQPRLGRWWRLWIACSSWLSALGLVIATRESGWSDGGIRVLAVCAVCSVLALALGLTIAWVRNGKRA